LGRALFAAAGCRPRRPDRGDPLRRARPRPRHRPGCRDARGADDGVDEPRGGGGDARLGARLLLLAQPWGALAQGRELGPGAAPRRSARRLRWRYGAAARAPARRGLPHRAALVLLHRDPRRRGHGDHGTGDRPGGALRGARGVSGIPVTVLTGFLGAGKTTLLNRLLRHPDLARTAVLVNEFGEIGLDHLLVERIEGDVVLLASGCLCCTVRGELVESLNRLAVQRTAGALDFDRVVIETTGLA